MADTDTHDADNSVQVDGETLVKNKKSGNVYFVRRVNPTNHEVVGKSEFKDMKDSGKLDKYLKQGQTKSNNKAARQGEKDGSAAAARAQAAKDARNAKTLVSKPNDPAVREHVRKALEQKARDANQEVFHRNLFGKTYVIGQDAYGSRSVYDWDGKSYGWDQFRDVLRDRRRLEQRLNNIHKIDLYLGSIDKETDATINAARQTGAVSYEFLTDNIQVKGKLTRTYPVVDHKGRKLIVEGRFKGHYLEDMINRAGRQVAGTGYVLDANGYARPIAYKGEDGATAFRVQHEPYVTQTASGLLHVVLPENDKIGRKALRELGKTFKNVREVGENSYELTHEEFDLVNEALGGVALSESASKGITDTIKERQELAEAEANRTYAHISTGSIAGMKTTFADGRPREFMAHQKKAIDTVCRKGNGVVGLDTGTGKTPTAVGIMMKWREDGTLKKDGKNGKTLFVVPPSLKGNFPAQIREWVEDGDDVMKDVEVVSYTMFTKMMETPEGKAELESYGATFFDEAQALRTGKSKVSKMAMSYNHPRKIALTASVLEKSPADLYNLIAIANNDASKTPEERQDARNRFINTFCDKLGTKVIGLKEDPTTKAKFAAWVRKNCMYIDKLDVKEDWAALPAITPRCDRTRSVKMEGGTLDKYRELAAPIQDTLGRMMEKYKNGKLRTGDVNQELNRVMGQLATLKKFSNNPEDYVSAEEVLEKVSERFPASMFETVEALDAMGTEVDLDYEDDAEDGKVNFRAKTHLMMTQWDLVSKNPKQRTLVLDTLSEMGYDIDNSGRVSLANPKATYAADWAINHLTQDSDNRLMTFTDDPDLAQKTGAKISREVPGKRHVVALNNQILVYKDGKIVETYRPTTKLFNADGQRVPKEEWQAHLIGKFQKESDVASYNLTKAYTTGHNIQTCNKILHLDRNSWNNENMKQREARAYRTGADRDRPIEVQTLDLVNDDGDSINEIERYSMDIEHELFTELITKSFGEDFEDNEKIADIAGLVQNKESLAYALDPSVLKSSKIINNTFDEAVDPYSNVATTGEDDNE